MILRLDKTDSTNLHALREFPELADGTLLTADEQTAGIGRRGRLWESPSGVNLYATFVLKRIDFPVGDAMLIGGLAVLDALRRFASGVDFWIKWPNDVCCGRRPKRLVGAERDSAAPNTAPSAPDVPRSHSPDGASTAPGYAGMAYAGSSNGFKKIAGVLAQTHFPRASNTMDGLVLGMGVNLNMPPEALELIGRPAASIFSETGLTVEPAEFATVLLDALTRYRKIACLDGDALFNRWVDANGVMGGSVEIRTESGDAFIGEVVGFRRGGEIVIRSGDGVELAFSAGDISPPRRVLKAVR